MADVAAKRHTVWRELGAHFMVRYHAPNSYLYGTKMRASTPLIATVSLFASSAWAQVNPCAVGQNNICVSFANSQSVPLTFEAVVLMSLMLATFALFKLRKRSSGLFSLFLSAALGALMVYQTTSDSYANGYVRVYFTNGSPAIFRNDAGPIVFVNDTTYNNTITAMTFNGNTYNPVNPAPIGGYEACFVGKVLVPTTGGVTGMCVVQGIPA